MSGLDTVRETLGKPMTIVAICGAVLVTGMATLWWASDAKSVTERGSLQPACIALAIDRDTRHNQHAALRGDRRARRGKEPVAKVGASSPPMPCDVC